MAEPRKNHLNIDGGQIKEDEHTVSSYKPIPESDTDFRSSKTSIHKSKEKVSADGAEEKLLDKEEEAKIIRVDMADAKYVVGDHRNGDAKIELDANKKQFSGLTKEELLKYAEDPFWVRLRWAMFVLFWVLWLAMLAAAIAIIVQAPKCALPTPKTWYEKGPHVDMSSMQSYSEIEGKLSELKESNIAGIFTYVCKDPYEVLDEKPGCITHFKEFVDQAQKYGIKVIVDLVANYVPNTHRWFQLSENRSADYDTFFTWAKGKDYESDSTKQNPPNGWVSTLNEPAWKWSDSRQEYYLHQFAEDQPDLNFHNPKVVEKFDAVIKAWIDAGADGIRLRHARELLVDSSLAEEVQDSGAVGADHSQYRYWQHRRTADRPELDALLAHWAHLAQASGEKVFTIMETETRTELYLLDRNTSYLRPPSARPVRAAAAAAAAGDIGARVKRWPLMQLVDGDDDAELAVFSMLLPAAPVLSPQQLPVKDNNTDASTKFAHASSLRADHVIAHGRSEVAAVSAKTPDAQADQLLACARWMEGHLCYLGLYNPGLAPARANLTALAMLPPTLKVHYMSSAVKHNTNYTSSMVVPIDNVLVPSKSSVVFSFNYKSTVET